MVLKEESGDWVSESRKTNRLLFSELDVLLRALDRFFTSENLTASGEDLTTRNFYDELVTIRDTILRVLGILEVVIPENRKNVYWFQKFAETKFLSATRRDAVRESLYRQDTPEKGLYLLYDSFINLKGVISDLIRTGAISYMSFMNIGHMMDKEIRENRYFNPFSRDPNPEFDHIGNDEIRTIIKGITDKDLRKCVSVIYIYLFRLLRFLSFVDIDTQRSVSLNSSLVMLILLRSEISMFQAFLEKSLKKKIEPDLAMLLKAVSYQFTMENRRVFLQELKDIHRKKASPHFRGRIENSHGILRNLTEHSIVQLTQYFRPETSGETVFVSFVTKLQQSIRLREDIVALHRFLGLLEKKETSLREWGRVFESLRSYMLYFESFTFRLLRHDDYEEFAHFFNEMNGVKRDAAGGGDFRKIMERVRHFKIYVETTLRHIENRSELNGKELDLKRVEDLMGQYIS
ncbi:MAG: hypothetical protein M0Z79_02210 [Nitrospiraceae bacterium]|nr:hypothetical protein [Nitrospiraceae bacterium]